MLLSVMAVAQVLTLKLQGGTAVAAVAEFKTLASDGVLEEMAANLVDMQEVLD